MLFPPAAVVYLPPSRSCTSRYRRLGAALHYLERRTNFDGYGALTGQFGGVRLRRRAGDHPLSASLVWLLSPAVSGQAVRNAVILTRPVL
jgi:hypothetical protein